MNHAKTDLGILFPSSGGNPSTGPRELEVKMRVNSATHLAKGAEMTKRALELAHAKLPDDEIAAILTR